MVCKDRVLGFRWNAWGASRLQSPQKAESKVRGRIKSGHTKWPGGPMKDERIVEKLKAKLSEYGMEAMADELRYAGYRCTKWHGDGERRYGRIQNYVQSD